MGEATTPEGERSPSSSEMVRFIQAFGSRASALLRERKQAIEDLVTRLAGVHSARLEMTESGGVERVHVVADDRFSPAQHMRHIRSALLAAHDLEIDLGQISVITLHDGGDREDRIQRPPLRDSRPRLTQINYQQEGLKIIAHAELDWRGRTFRGLSEDADTSQGRVMAAARATLQALEKVSDGRVAFSLEGLTTQQLFKRTVTVASVRVVSELHRADLLGCAMVSDDPNHAAAHAVLGAVNRSFVRVLGTPTSHDDDGHSAGFTPGAEPRRNGPTASEDW